MTANLLRVGDGGAAPNAGEHSLLQNPLQPLQQRPSLAAVQQGHELFQVAARGQDLAGKSAQGFQQSLGNGFVAEIPG